MDFLIGAAHAATGGDDHGGGAVGLPQLDFATFPSQIFWLLVALVVLYLIFKGVLRDLGDVMEERADTIEDDLDRAQDYSRRTAEADAAYERAKAEARAEAQRIAEATRKEIMAEAEEAAAKADAEIAARTEESERRIAEIRAEAASAVAQVARDTAEALVEAVAPGVADPEAVRAAVDRRTAEEDRA